jgi:toxin ParE1/3/4
MIVRYTDGVKEDLEKSFGWYEAQRRGLGFDFLDCIESSIMKILISPELYNIIYSNFQDALLEDSHFRYFSP